MFCPKCGTLNPDLATACVKCGTALPAARSSPVAAQASQAAAKVQSAMKDALGALKIFVTNPVPGLPKAVEQLGPARALGAGLCFGAIASVGIFLWMYLAFDSFGRPHGIGGFFKALISAVVPFVTLYAACLAVRLVFGGQGSFRHDGFITGSALLPVGLYFLLAGILGPRNSGVAFLFLPFAFCTGILLLFSGCTRILNLSERAATIALPIMIVISAWLSRVIYSAMFRDSSASLLLPPLPMQ